MQLSLDEWRRAGSSKSRTQNGAVNKDIDSLDEEITHMENKISDMQARVRDLKAQREALRRQLRDSQLQQGRHDQTPAGDIDYTGTFEWTGALCDKLKKVFGFESFRSCQEG